jgi:hypothetical protein
MAFALLRLSTPSLSGKSANFAEELVKLSTDPNIVQTMRHLCGSGRND